MDETTVDAYLGRIGAARPVTVDAAALRELHRAHLMTVPFENLSIHLGEPIVLDHGALLDKVVTRRRGGFCYELNGVFALLLRALGAEVAMVAARVCGSDSTGPPFDHMALLVRCADGSGPWLADVGFGSHSVYPLLFDSRAEQHDPAAVFQLADAAEGDVQVVKDGEPQYLIERRARELADYVPTCWYQQTSPDSHFTRSTVCSRLTDDGRVSISGRTLITTVNGTRTEVEYPSDEALLAGYQEHFGVVLSKVPLVRTGRAPGLS